MSPSSALLPKDTPNVKFRMELASQIQDSPSSLAHLDANLMLNIGDTPNDKIRYAYRFGDDFGYRNLPSSVSAAAATIIFIFTRHLSQWNQPWHRIRVVSPAIYQGHAPRVCLLQRGQSPL
jgi:hypothetical protein